MTKNACPASSVMIKTVIARQMERNSQSGIRKGGKGKERGKGASLASSSSSSSLSPPECPICLDLFYYPITTSCGHSFCFHCLFLSRQRDCPICRHGPLLLEKGDFEPDPLLEMRVRLENTVNAFKVKESGRPAFQQQQAATATMQSSRNAQSHNDLGSNGNGSGGKSIRSRGGKATDQLEAPEVVIRHYKNAMNRWCEQRDHQRRIEIEKSGGGGGGAMRKDEKDKEVVKVRTCGGGGGRRQEGGDNGEGIHHNCAEYAAASLEVRTRLGALPMSHYTHDQCEHHHMFYENGFMWRRAPSIAVVRSCCATGTGNQQAPPLGFEQRQQPRPNGGGHNLRQNERDREQDALVHAQPSSQHSPLSHIEHLLSIEIKDRDRDNIGISVSRQNENKNDAAVSCALPSIERKEKKEVGDENKEVSSNVKVSLKKASAKRLSDPCPPDYSLPPSPPTTSSKNNRTTNASAANANSQQQHALPSFKPVSTNNSNRGVVMTGGRTPHPVVGTAGSDSSSNLPPITITPRGTVWVTRSSRYGDKAGGEDEKESARRSPKLIATTATAHQGSGEEHYFTNRIPPSGGVPSFSSPLTTIDANIAYPSSSALSRPQSAAEQKEDNQIIAETRAFVKRNAAALTRLQEEGEGGKKIERAESIEKTIFRKQSSNVSRKPPLPR